MDKLTIRILVLDDDPFMLKLLAQMLATGRMVGVETLVRWRHPEDGIVSPDQFVGVAQEHGLINDLTHAVLISAVFRAKVLQQAGLALIVAVNVSMDNLTSLGFPDVVAEGVENRADWDFLRRAGCDLAQGYFIARPMPAADLPGWIEEWNVRLQKLQMGVS